MKNSYSLKHARWLPLKNIFCVSQNIFSFSQEFVYFTNYFYILCYSCYVSRSIFVFQKTFCNLRNIFSILGSIFFYFKRYILKLSATVSGITELFTWIMSQNTSRNVSQKNCLFYNCMLETWISFDITKEFRIFTVCYSSCCWLDRKMVSKLYFIWEFDRNLI